MRYTAIANTAIIHAFNPVITGIAAALLIRERLTLQNYFGGAILLRNAGAIALVGVLALRLKGNLGNLVGLQINRGNRPGQ
ncbi:hypothetical protein [Thermoleptolyngbya sp. C42_A2020_037]|uniref:hypothetical protein n=1 Tax=Thermoleptolyngbya sp. C42_A2020_037 TaxID=2747799 RepID=UPI00345BC59F